MSDNCPGYDLKLSKTKTFTLKKGLQMKALLNKLDSTVLINYLINNDYEHPYDFDRTQLVNVVETVLSTRSRDIGLNLLTERHWDVSSPYTHTTFTPEELSIVTELCWHNKEAGFAEGVWLVTVPADTFTSPYKKIEDTDEFINVFGSRRPNEEPVMFTYILGGTPTPADSCQIVVYAHDTLATDGDNSTSLPYEIVSINGACDAIGEVPMDTVTMARNTLNKVGGTKTDYPADVWAHAAWFHNTHCLCLPK